MLRSCLKKSNDENKVFLYINQAVCFSPEYLKPNTIITYNYTGF